MLVRVPVPHIPDQPLELDGALLLRAAPTTGKAGQAALACQCALLGLCVLEDLRVPMVGHTRSMHFTHTQHGQIVKGAGSRADSRADSRRLKAECVHETSFHPLRLADLVRTMLTGALGAPISKVILMLRV